MIPVFDGHNDILWRIGHAPEKRDTIWLTGEGKGHIDLPRLRRGGFAGGFFALYIDSPGEGDLEDLEALMDSPPYAFPLPPPIDHVAAMPAAMALAGHLRWMERQGGLRIVDGVAAIRACMAEGTIAAVMHMEGAEAIGPDLDALHVWHAAGLRSLGPVWSRPTVFGHGVPFAFPSTGDTGEGLTEAGRRLVGECNALRILIDLSHLNEKGFFDVARLSDAPLVATHSNAHAVCPTSRNLTDRQLAAIRESGGLVGLNFATCFLNPDGRRQPTRGLEPLLRHLDHLVSRLGEDHVGLGSDFDGATIPEEIGDAAGLQGLLAAIAAHGFGRDLVERIAWRNWLAVLERTWGR
ncbi:MAG: dipeptidase [Rhodobacteraceae bacterium]|nr:dipeptidase [Paracoccaceae bacterium]